MLLSGLGVAVGFVPGLSSLKFACGNDPEIQFQWQVPKAHFDTVKESLRFKGEVTPEKDAKGLPLIFIFAGISLLPSLVKAVLALRQIMILTQYKSHSLNKHLRDGWSIFNPEIGEFITAIPAQMRMGAAWYTGTADAIYQNRYLLERSDIEYVVVLAGDHIYRMDYAEMLKEHIFKMLDVTVASMPVSIEEARAFGVIEIDENDLIQRFFEKVEDPPSIPGDPGRALASMGVYVFSLPDLLEVLQIDHLEHESGHDFGKNILPWMVGTKMRVGAYHFGSDKGRVLMDSYWRDVGTIDAYYRANMDLLKPAPPINLYQKDWLIRTYHGQYPSARMVPSASGEVGFVENALLAGGDVIIGARVIQSIPSHDVRVEAGALVEKSILFDRVLVGEGARLRKCIIDKGVTIPPGASIGWDMEEDKRRFTVSDNGVVVVTKGYKFPKPTTPSVSSSPISDSDIELPETTPSQETVEEI